MDVLKFSGVYPESWIFAITEYFSLLNTPADQWRKIVGFNLEGAAAEWFQWMTRNDLITTCARFEERVRNCFGPSEYEDPNGMLSKLLQLGTVKDYQREFEKLMNQATNIPDSLLISYYIFGLKLHLQREFPGDGYVGRIVSKQVVNDGDIQKSSVPVTTNKRFKIFRRISELEMKVLVDGKQDEAKVDKRVLWLLSKTKTARRESGARTRLKWCPIRYNLELGRIMNVVQMICFRFQLHTDHLILDITLSYCQDNFKDIFDKEKSANMLPVVSQICRFAPQLHESAGGLPSLKLSLHSCSLPGSTNAMGIETSIALVLPAREHECTQVSFWGRGPAALL
ncbi:ty3-gypsy retrotransposon protein [Tanacetum coccineum]